MGYTEHRGTRGVERFMKHYFLVAKDVGDLTRIFCAALEIESEVTPRFSLKSLRALGRKARTIDGFAIESGRLTVAKTTAFADDPVNFLRIFRVAQAHGFDIHPYALRLIRKNLRLVDSRLRENREIDEEEAVAEAVLGVLTGLEPPEKPPADVREDAADSRADAAVSRRDRGELQGHGESLPSAPRAFPRPASLR